MAIETVNDIEPRSQFTANGTQTVFPCDWAARVTDYVIVRFGEDEAPTIGYTFDPSGLNTDDGFNVVFNSPPPSGTLITVYREGDLERQTNYGQQKDFKAAVVNAEFVDVVLRLQELKRDLRRTVRLPVTDPTGQMVLPGKTTRALKYLSFNANGDPITITDAPGGSGGGGGIEVYDGTTEISNPATRLVFGKGARAFETTPGVVEIEAVEQLYGLADDGTTDVVPALVELIETAVAEDWPALEIVGKPDGSSVLKLGRRASIDALPPRVSFDRVTFLVDAANEGGLFIRGDEVELPASGKAKLWADVNVAGGPVSSFDIDVAPNNSIVSLLTVGATVRIRGQNGIDGIVLDGYDHEAVVTSLTLVATNRYTLGISPGLPDTVPGDVWKRTWTGSLWNPTNGGPASDDTLISVLSTQALAANITDSRTATIAEGRAAALGITAGAWVEVRDDATGSDFHGTSNEPLHVQMVQVTGVAVSGGSPDTLTFAEPVRGALTTANTARVTVLAPSPKTHIRGPGPGFPVRFVGTPAASPARRAHFIETRYCIEPTLEGWHYEYVAADGYIRGAALRSSIDYRPRWHDCHILGPTPDFAGAYNAGDHYQGWIKGSTGAVVEHCTFTGGRHGLVVANGKRPVVRFNTCGLSSHQNLDFHGENEVDAQIYGNTVIRGPKWADRSRHIAIQLGNQTHTFGTRGAVLWGNRIDGFDGVDDVGYLVVSGCKDTAIDIARSERYATLVSVDADQRAPEVLIERVTITGIVGAGTTAVSIDGRMQVWESGGEVEGASASRLTYIDDSTGTRRYSTADNGTLGSVNPTATSGTEVSGDCTLTYVGLVADQVVPIDVVSIAADLTQAPIKVSQFRANNVTIAPTTVSQVTPAEITAGTETSVRLHSPADIVTFINEHGGEGGLSPELEFRLQQIEEDVIPDGTLFVAGRGSEGSVVQWLQDPAGSILFDGSTNLIKAIPKLGSSQQGDLVVTASRSLAATDRMVITASDAALDPSSLRVRRLVARSADLSTPIVFTVPESAQSGPYLIFRAHDQAEAVSVVLAGLGTLRGVDWNDPALPTLNLVQGQMLCLWVQNNGGFPQVSVMFTSEDRAVPSPVLNGVAPNNVVTFDRHAGLIVQASGSLEVLGTGIPDGRAFPFAILATAGVNITFNGTPTALVAGDMIVGYVYSSTVWKAKKLSAGDFL